MAAYAPSRARLLGTGPRADAAGVACRSPAMAGRSRHRVRVQAAPDGPRRDRIEQAGSRRAIAQPHLRSASADPTASIAAREIACPRPVCASTTAQPEPGIDDPDERAISARRGSNSRPGCGVRRHIAGTSGCSRGWRPREAQSTTAAIQRPAGEPRARHRRRLMPAARLLLPRRCVSGTSTRARPQVMGSIEDGDAHPGDRAPRVWSSAPDPVRPDAGHINRSADAARRDDEPNSRDHR